MNVFWFFMMGCTSQEFSFREYDISIHVQNAGDNTKHQATILYEWFGEGDLRYPMYPIEEVEFDGDVLEEWKPLVKQGEGEGLVVYVWEDQDNDDVFCSLENKEERAGLLILDEASFVLDIDIELTHTCMGFESLYTQTNIESEN